MECEMWEGVGEAGEDDPGVRMVVVVCALSSPETVVSLEGYWARLLALRHRKFFLTNRLSPLL